MKDMGNVQGSAEQAKPLIVGKDTVYVHTNIVQMEDTEGNLIDNLYSYDEVQYTINEYLKLVIDENNKATSDITDLQLALAEIYELTEGGTN